MQKINNNISFKSNINIVPLETFKKLAKGTYIDHLHIDKKIISNDEFFTHNVRSCSSGGFISDEEAVGFHLEDSLGHLMQARDLAKEIVGSMYKPLNGLLLGGKAVYGDRCTHSMTFFETLKQEFLKSLENISVFEKHNKIYSQTHLCYSKKSDDWHICCNFVDDLAEPVKSVDSLEGLLAAYDKISIAKTDNLFINGKEISRQKAPNIFAK